MVDPRHDTSSLVSEGSGAKPINLEAIWTIWFWFYCVTLRWCWTWSEEKLSGGEKCVQSSSGDFPLSDSDTVRGSGMSVCPQPSPRDYSPECLLDIVIFHDLVITSLHYHSVLIYYNHRRVFSDSLAQMSLNNLKVLRLCPLQLLFSLWLAGSCRWHEYYFIRLRHQMWRSLNMRLAETGSSVSNFVEEFHDWGIKS